MGIVNRKMETLKKNQKEMIEIKKNCNGNEEAFYGLINRLDTNEERINELKDKSIKT